MHDRNHLNRLIRAHREAFLRECRECRERTRKESGKGDDGAGAAWWVVMLLVLAGVVVGVLCLPGR